MPHVCACGILAYQKKRQKMRINAAYKEALKKILETGDVSRVSHEARMYSYGKYSVAFWILPTGRERTDTVVKGEYSLDLSCFAGKAVEKHELFAHVADAINSFLSLAEETQEYDEASGDAMFALTEWQKAYKECADTQSDTSTSRDGSARVPGADA